MKANLTKLIVACLWPLIPLSSLLAQNVGIGVAAPIEKLEVAGNVKGVNLLSTGAIGIGTTAPFYKLHVYDGNIGITRTVGNATWYFAHNTSTNALNFNFNGDVGFSNPLTLSTNGFVGIGKSSPLFRLDVNGNFHTEAEAVIDGNLTVNNGKGILQNSQGSGQLKYYTRTATFTVTNLPGFGLSSETSIGFAGVFSSPPKVFVGDIVSTGGTVGELYRVQLVIYDVTTTNCKARLLNTSPNPVSYATTWNIVCIGE
jgi:hypothetical protein